MTTTSAIRDSIRTVGTSIAEDARTIGDIGHELHVVGKMLLATMQQLYADGGLTPDEAHASCAVMAHLCTKLGELQVRATGLSESLGRCKVPTSTVSFAREAASAAREIGAAGGDILAGMRAGIDGTRLGSLSQFVAACQEYRGAAESLAEVISEMAVAH